MNLDSIGLTLLLTLADPPFSQAAPLLVGLCLRVWTRRKNQSILASKETVSEWKSKELNDTLDFMTILTSTVPVVSISLQQK